jgi:predicted amino acid-binding ACT domain protein
LPRLRPDRGNFWQHEAVPAVSAIGKDRPGLAHEVVRTVADCGASISESRMLPLGGEFGMLILVTGNWHAIARLESELARLGESAGLSLQVRRTEPRALREELIPYSIDVIGPDTPASSRAWPVSSPPATSRSPKSYPGATTPPRPARPCSPCR